MEGCGRKIGPFDCCTIVQGDCLDVVAQMPPTVNLIVTSPPYYNAKDYGEGVGNWACHDDYIQWLKPFALLVCGGF